MSSYLTANRPTSSYSIKPHPTSRAPSHPTLSYIFLPPLTTSNHILPCRTSLPHPTV